MAKNIKIVIFTGDFGYAVRRGLVEIDQDLANISWLVVIHKPQRKALQLFKNQWFNLRRNGWRWIPYQALAVIQKLLTRPAIPTPPDCPGAHYTRSALESYLNIQVVPVSDIHAEESLKTIQAFKPDLGLSLAAPILQSTVFEIPELGTLNLHKGKVPDYHGMPPAFWELWNREKSVGCTVHWVETKLDSGDIACETKVDCEQFSTVRGLQLKLDETGIDLMRQAVFNIFSDRSARTPQAIGGKTNRKPTLEQIEQLNSHLQHLLPSAESNLTRIIKRLRSKLVWAVMRTGLRQNLTPRITVLLYHRITDSTRDNLTVGIEQFDRQMTLIRKHCQVLSIDDVISLNGIPKTNKPLVAVTFDDGYLDNYENAAPILVRHQIPAAFFVSTGLINTNDRFPHDVRRGNKSIPLMNWDQLRQMHKWGFTIGSHTVTHIDCAGESEALVLEELAQSHKDLERELKLTDQIFAYPYGGTQHMTPQRLELVKKAGYQACLAAYGGVNMQSVDPFNVLRRGIHWEFSDHAFLYECLGL